MWGYTNDLLDDFRCRLHFREGRFFQEKEETVTSGIRDERDRPSSAAQLERAVTYEISDDRRKVRMLHPSLQVAGAEPVSIYMDMDAAAVDALLRQVAEIRAQMLPALRRN
jgi:hypothetical protein